LPVLEVALKKWVVEFFKKVKNFFVTMDIWSYPGLDKLYLGVVVKYYSKLPII
jgi:hypothetical protein